MEQLNDHPTLFELTEAQHQARRDKLAQLAQELTIAYEQAHDTVEPYSVGEELDITA